MIQSQNIHRKGDRAMQHEAHPDVAVFEAQPAEKNTGEDSGKRLRHRLLEMDHCVRHGHRKYGVKAKRRLEAVEQKAAKKELQPEKLEEIDELPNEQRRA